MSSNRKCTALVRKTPTTGRRLRRRYTTAFVNGHEFVADFDWRCRTCNERLDPRLRPGAVSSDLDVESMVAPCPDPGQHVTDAIMDLLDSTPEIEN